MSRLLKNNLMDDVFNTENESFMQETRLLQSEYSVNLPTIFWYKKKEWRGWINVVNPFRASIVLGTPGSGKSYAVVNQYIKQQIEKGFSMYIYDFKFPDLSTIAYNHLLNNQSLSRKSCQNCQKCFSSFCMPQRKIRSKLLTNLIIPFLKSFSFL